MIITKETDYALRIMDYLAVNTPVPPANGVKSSAIAEAICVPPGFTQKILRKLQSGGYIRSYKGAEGGYALIKAPSEITLLEIIECVGGPLTLIHCNDRELGCAGNAFEKSACFYHKIFDGINDMISEKLRKITIADAVRYKTKNSARR